MRLWTVIFMLVFVSASGLQAVRACGTNYLLQVLQSQCGQAFAGQVMRSADGDAGWREAPIVMHVRDCGARSVRVPLHVGDDRSRIWVLRLLDDNQMQLKHDHRHADGLADTVTNYGGTTRCEQGRNEDGMTVLSFPVDAESIALFRANGLSASVANTWHLWVGRDTFRYQLTRPDGRDFMIEFDLTKPVPVPPAAWDKAAG
jgi:hypothetical protein